MSGTAFHIATLKRSWKKEGIISLHHETIYPHILVDKKAGGELYIAFGKYWRNKPLAFSF
jgi:hypothetical protein